MIDLSTLDSETRECLEKFGFTEVPFFELAKKLEREGFDPARNRLTCEVELPSADAITHLPEPGNPEKERLTDLGKAAIESGEVGVAILNGGMATRFGGVVKGTVPAIDGRSFLDLKLSQVAKTGKGRSPALLMNSFATIDSTKDHLEKLNIGCEVRHFCQMVSLRLTKSGELFLTEEGKPSLHAPGHGDLPYALHGSGELDRFIEGGGKIITVSNVDNLGASLDPLVIGAHLDGKKPMTVELVKTYPGDVGGSPTLVDGKIAIIETFRIPESFRGTFPTFNTNTFVFDAKALKGNQALDWFEVVKKVDGREAVQFERLMGQLTELLDVTWLQVPREGEKSRFLPIKTPEDLDRDADILRSALKYQGVL